MEKFVSELRVRMSAKDAHYGGNLVDGAHMLHLFGDVAMVIVVIAIAVDQYDRDPALLHLLVEGIRIHDDDNDPVQIALLCQGQIALVGIRSRDDHMVAFLSGAQFNASQYVNLTFLHKIIWVWTFELVKVTGPPPIKGRACSLLDHHFERILPYICFFSSAYRWTTRITVSPTRKSESSCW